MRSPILPALLTLALLLAAPSARADFFGAPVVIQAPATDEAAQDTAPAAQLSDITVTQEPAPAFGFRWNTETHDWDPTHERTYSTLTLRNDGEAEATLSLTYAVATAEAAGADAERLLSVLGLSGAPDGEAVDTLSVTVPAQGETTVYLRYAASPPASGGDASLRLDVTVTYTLQ